MRVGGCAQGHRRGGWPALRQDGEAIPGRELLLLGMCDGDLHCLLCEVWRLDLWVDERRIATAIVVVASTLIVIVVASLVFEGAVAELVWVK